MLGTEFVVRPGGQGMGSDAADTGTRVPRVAEHLDLVFGLLQRARRRYVLYYLSARKDEPVDAGDLVSAIRTYETGDSPGTDPPPRKELWIALYHTHLPRLADAGVLEYDDRRGTVRSTMSPAVEEWVAHARHREIE